jgi:menaquinone-9 beta-reductase
VVAGHLIVGGGLAGGAAALALAQDGQRVTLLEREAGAHDKICGEFLSAEAQADLARLGIHCGGLGAVAVDTVRVARGNRAVEAKLPFAALGVTRRVLDAVLLDAAALAGARIERGVRAASFADGTVRTSAGDLRADRVLLATGKHDLRGAAPAGARASDAHVGFKLHWRVPAASLASDAIELVLFAGGYAGLQPVAPGVLNLCLVVRKAAFQAAGASWPGLLARLMEEPHLARRLGDAEPLWPRPLTIAALPYGRLLGPDHNGPANLYRLGDQAAMTASLTGDGMALALRSGCIAARSAAASEPAQLYQARLKRAVGGQVRRAMALQRATERPWLVGPALAVMARAPRLLAAMAGATRLAD